MNFLKCKGEGGGVTLILYSNPTSTYVMIYPVYTSYLGSLAPGKHQITYMLDQFATR